MKFFIYILIFLSSVILCGKQVYEIPFTQNLPITDGVYDDQEWSDALYLNEFFQITPGDNSTPSQSTEIFIKYSEKSLYFLMKCYFDTPEAKTSIHCSRDKIYFSDRCYFYLDTFLSNSRAYYLGCNAFGEQADGLITEANGLDTSIDLYYLSAGQDTDYGYLAEIELPLQSISYQSGKDVEWGFFAKRQIFAVNEEISLTRVDRNADNYFENYALIRFAELPVKRNLVLQAGSIYLADIDKWEDEELRFEGNVFLEPFSNLTVTGTINPDFSIIEADGLTIDTNSRYPEYYTEKRPFFIEKNNSFNSPLNIFYSRQIADPLWGVKLSYNKDDNNFHALISQDEDVPSDRFFDGDSVTTSDALFAFAFYRRVLQDGNGELKLALTERKYNSLHNSVANIDGYFSLGNGFMMNGQLAGSINEINDKKKLEGHCWYAELEYEKEWISTNLTAEKISPDFRADFGFMNETNISNIGNHTELKKSAKDDTQLIRFAELGFNLSKKYDSEFNKEFEWEISPYAGASLQRNIDIWGGYEREMVLFNNEKNSFGCFWLELTLKTFRIVGITSKIEYGDQLSYYSFDNDGSSLTEDFLAVNNTVYLRPLNSLDIELIHRYHELQRVFISRTSEINAKFQFNKDFWLRLIIQHENLDSTSEYSMEKTLNFYPLFAYQPNAAMSLYLGASLEYTEDSEKDYEQKEVFAKISYSFDLI